MTRKTPQSDSEGFSRVPGGLTSDTVRTSVSVALWLVLGPCRTIGPMPEPIVITVDELSADYAWRSRPYDKPYTHTWSVTMGTLVLGRIREYPHSPGWFPLVWVTGAWWLPPYMTGRRHDAVTYLTELWNLTRGREVIGAPVTVQWGAACESYVEHQRVCIKSLT